MIAKQMEIRANIKEYFDLAYDGTPIIVPRKNKKNVVIISEDEYNRLQRANRLAAYANMYSISQNRPNDTSANADPMDVKSFNLAKLDVIRDLQEGWNGNSAPAFSKTLISKISCLLEDLVIQPQVFPTALATIQFEYDNARRDHMEIEIGETDVAEIFLVSYDGHESFETLPVSSESINERVKVFYG